MDTTHSTNKEKEEICIHVVEAPEANAPNTEDYNFRFDVAPFRQTFFRYSMYGLSEVVRSSAFVYASHHSSESAWLQIKKLSVALVGSSTIPNLALFTPTVTEIVFMGHITYPSVAFKLLPQLSILEKVVFNIGFGGHITEFQETMDEFLEVTPEVPSVTHLEIRINHHLYQTCNEELKNVFNHIIESILKHSLDSFPNLQNMHVDLPHAPLFLHRISMLVNRNGILQHTFEIRVMRHERKIQVLQKPDSDPGFLSFDPCARFPTNSQYNHLRQIGHRGFST